MVVLLEKRKRGYLCLFLSSLKKYSPCRLTMTSGICSQIILPTMIEINRSIHNQLVTLDMFQHKDQRPVTSSLRETQVIIFQSASSNSINLPSLSSIVKATFSVVMPFPFLLSTLFLPAMLTLARVIPKVKIDSASISSPQATHLLSQRSSAKSKEPMPLRTQVLLVLLVMERQFWFLHLALRFKPGTTTKFSYLGSYLPRALDFCFSRLENEKSEMEHSSKYSLPFSLSFSVLSVGCFGCPCSASLTRPLLLNLTVEFTMPQLSQKYINPRLRTY